MSLSNSKSLIADTYYTIDEETGQLLDMKFADFFNYGFGSRDLEQESR